MRSGHKGIRIARRKLIIIATIILSLMAVTVAYAAQADYCNQQGLSANCTYSTTSEETAFYNLLNPLRRNFGAGDLQSVESLRQAALMHAAYLAARNELEHGERSGFFGAGPGDRALRAGYGNSNVGENAITTSTPSASFVGWLDSYGHCTNMLRQSYRDSGFAIVTTSDGVSRAVQVFGGGGTGDGPTTQGTAFCCMMSPPMNSADIFAGTALRDAAYINNAQACMAVSGTSFTFPTLAGTSKANLAGTTQTYVMPDALKAIVGDGNAANITQRANATIANTTAGTTDNINPQVSAFLRTVNTCIQRDGGTPIRLNLRLQMFAQNTSANGATPAQVAEQGRQALNWWGVVDTTVAYAGNPADFLSKNYGDWTQRFNGSVGTILIGGGNLSFIRVQGSQAGELNAGTTLFTGIENGIDSSVDCAALKAGVSSSSENLGTRSLAAKFNSASYPLNDLSGQFRFFTTATRGRVAIGIYDASGRSVKWDAATNQYVPTEPLMSQHTVVLQPGNNMTLKVYAMSDGGADYTLFREAVGSAPATTTNTTTTTTTTNNNTNSNTTNTNSNTSTNTVPANQIGAGTNKTYIALTNAAVSLKAGEVVTVTELTTTGNLSAVVQVVNSVTNAVTQLKLGEKFTVPADGSFYFYASAVSGSGTVTANYSVTPAVVNNTTTTNTSTNTTAAGTVLASKEINQGAYEFVPINSFQGLMTFNLTTTQGLTADMSIYSYADRGYFRYDAATNSFISDFNNAGQQQTLAFDANKRLAFAVAARSGSGTFTITMTPAGSTTTASNTTTTDTNTTNSNTSTTTTDANNTNTTTADSGTTNTDAADNASTSERLVVQSEAVSAICVWNDALNLSGSANLVTLSVRAQRIVQEASDRQAAFDALASAGFSVQGDTAQDVNSVDPSGLVNPFEAMAVRVEADGSVSFYWLSGTGITPDLVFATVDGRCNLVNTEGTTAATEDAGGTAAAENTPEPAPQENTGETTENTTQDNSVQAVNFFGTMLQDDSLYSEPSDSSSVIIHMLRGENIEVIGQSSDGAWYQIYDSEGTLGWVHANLVAES